MRQTAPLARRRGECGAGIQLPSTSGRGEWGEGIRLPSPSGRRAGGEGNWQGIHPVRYCLRVGVAKVAQNRGFHHDFRPFITPMMYNAITIGTMPPSGILGKNRASCTFSGNILAGGVIATFRRNLATWVRLRHRQRRRLSSRSIRRAGNRASERHAGSSRADTFLPSVNNRALPRQHPADGEH